MLMIGGRFVLFPAFDSSSAGGNGGSVVDSSSVDRSSTQVDDFAKALRRVPSTDFCCWASGLVNVAGAQAVSVTLPLSNSIMASTFFDAFERSETGGDRALGVTNWLYARYLHLH